MVSCHGRLHSRVKMATKNIISIQEVEAEAEAEAAMANMYYCSRRSRAVTAWYGNPVVEGATQQTAIAYEGQG